MRNVKNFNEFINEELNISTYDNAGYILRTKKHFKRGDDLIKYGKNIFNQKLNDINKTVLNVDGEDISCEEFNITDFDSLTASKPSINIWVNYKNYKIMINISVDMYKNNIYNKNVDFNPSNGIINYDRKIAKKLLNITKQYIDLTKDLIYEVNPEIYEYVIDFQEYATINDFYN